MIDIHSHILHEVDDGSIDIDSSIEMLKIVRSHGVTDLVLTPHYRGEFKKSPNELTKLFSELRTRVESEGINVNLYLGQEIYVDKDYKSLIKDNSVLTMNGSKYILIEFDFEYQSDIINTVYELVREGYVPIVAHIERYGYVDFSLAQEVKNIGGLIQVNACSIVYRQPLKCKSLLRQMFRSNLVDFVAGDMHSEREYVMKKAYMRISKKYGQELAQAVFNGNANKIIKG